jgi:hypothetical protein
MWFLMAIAFGALFLQLLRSRSRDDLIIFVIALPIGLALGFILVRRIRGRSGRLARSARAAGALFGGTAVVRIPELRIIPSIRHLLTLTKQARLSQGMVTGAILIERGRITWTPTGRAIRLRVPRFSFSRDQIVGVDTGGLPGWGDSAALAIRLLDGSSLTFQTHGLAELRRALAEGGYPATVV